MFLNEFVTKQIITTSSMSRTVLTAGVSACLAVACHSGPEPEAAHTRGADEDGTTGAEDDFMEPRTEGPALEVPLIAKSGSSVSGEVRLTETSTGVRIEVSVANVEPGLHGIHIHEVADCSAPDATSAGGHLSPDDNPHGLPGESDLRHLGDLGNITIDQNGKGSLETQVRVASLADSGKYSLKGKALILHADPDVGVQPTGGSGKRIACAELTDEASLIPMPTERAIPPEEG